jgi:hypothetical protein
MKLRIALACLGGAACALTREVAAHDVRTASVRRLNSCPAGYYTDPIGDSCEPCGAGRYQV